MQMRCIICLLGLTTIEHWPAVAAETGENASRTSGNEGKQHHVDELQAMPSGQLLIYCLAASSRSGLPLARQQNGRLFWSSFLRLASLVTVA